LTLPQLSIRFGGKDFVLCPYNPSAEEVRGLHRFLYEVAQNFEVFSIFNVKITNSKRHKAVDVLFKAYLMAPLSCRSNLAGRTFNVLYSVPV
jgi:hypothetical protein